MLSVAEVEELLAGSLSMSDATGVEEIGAGAWSTAFGFTHDGRDLVVRIGKHVSDFRRDQAMSALATSTLPIPEVLSVGDVPSAGPRSLHYCISTRAFGVPLESCVASEWPSLAERIGDLLEAMRACSPLDLTPAAGISNDELNRAPWREQLLSIERDDLDPRGAGWPAKLATSARGSAAFAAGLAQLRRVKLGDVPLTLVHGDLINRNVHISDGQITGVFDWGCQRWGDHLYDLAWFDFWSPWYPDLDIDLLRTVLLDRWAIAGYVPHAMEERERACRIHIGLDHLIYAALTGSSSGLDDVVDRMTTLDLL